MALNKPCSVSSSPENVGVDCQVKMSATKMLIIVPQAAKWAASDEVDFVTYLQGKIHAAPSSRWFPMFGNIAPIRVFNDSKESDVIVTYDDGSQAFIRLGTITRSFMTNKGGFDLAKRLQSFNGFGGYAFIEIDQYNRVLRKKNADGTYSGVPLNMMYSPNPELANLKEEFRFGLTLNFSTKDYLASGEIVTSDTDLLDTVGLINSTISSAAAATTTKLKLAVATNGTDTDLVAAYPALAAVSAFSVTKNGSPVTPSGAAIVSGHIELTITGTTGDIFKVTGASPAAWLALNVAGYDASASTVSITIP